MLPGDVMNLRNLQILVLRNNDLLTIPREIGHLTNLRKNCTSKEQFDARGAQGVMDFIRSDQYKYLYGRQEVSSGAVPPKRNKDRKLSRKTMNQSQCA
ncbi:hypothetical protein KIN20_007478 [Parelaphostrongylus tenuis]|uniref:Uncharacterized protein n=1 Tax=Parelaphostrongylus tenuis TaxID=148309 RepID=A0AAD5MPR9_PARTN|nr:hypothetical protein KIN20_007478 [Parelaphostrongylus tenuis]